MAASWFDDQGYTGAPPQRVASWFDVPGTTTGYMPGQVLTADQYTQLTPAQKNAYDQQFMSPDQIQRVNQTLVSAGKLQPGESAYAPTPAGTAALGSLQAGNGGPSTTSGPANGDWKSWFMNLVGNRPSSYALIEQLQPQLQAAGVQVHYNQEGQPSKLILPNGHYISAVDANGGWRWEDQGTAANPVTTGNGTVGLNSLTGPQGSFSFPQFSYPGFNQTFTAPTAAEANQSPAEQAQLQLGEQAIQASAAAKGNLLTGTTLQGLEGYASNLAATNYQNVYQNALGQYQAALNTYLANYNTAQGAYQTNYGAQSGTYGLNFGVSNTLNQEQFNNQYSLADLGLRAAGASSAAAGQFGQNAAGTVTGAGNAAAAGTVGAANAYGTALGQIGNTAQSLPYLNMVLAQPTNPYGAGTPTSSYGIGSLAPNAVPSNSSPSVWNGLFAPPPASSYGAL